MAKKACWNNISNETSYLISEIKNDELNTFKKREERKKENEKKITKSIEQITVELK